MAAVGHEEEPPVAPAPGRVEPGGLGGCDQRVAGAVFGADRLRKDELPSMGAEDFAYMLQAKPGCYVWLGNGPGTGGCTLHNPHYDFNDDIVPWGISYWVKLVESALPVN